MAVHCHRGALVAQTVTAQEDGMNEGYRHQVSGSTATAPPISNEVTRRCDGSPARGRLTSPDDGGPSAAQVCAQHA